MKIFELFDRVIDYKWLAKDADAWVGEFEVQSKLGPLTYRVDIESGDEDGEWVFAFALDYESTRRIEADSGVSLSNSGGEFAVHSTILRMLADFIKRESPNIIQFTADGDNRFKLYSTMFNKLHKLIPEYKFQVRHSTRHTDGYMYSLELKKESPNKKL